MGDGVVGGAAGLGVGPSVLVTISESMTLYIVNEGRYLKNPLRGGLLELI